MMLQSPSVHRQLVKVTEHPNNYLARLNSMPQNCYQIHFCPFKPHDLMIAICRFHLTKLNFWTWQVFLATSGPLGMSSVQIQGVADAVNLMADQICFCLMIYATTVSIQFPILFYLTLTHQSSIAYLCHIGTVLKVTIREYIFYFHVLSQHILFWEWRSFHILPGNH